MKELQLSQRGRWLLASVMDGGDIVLHVSDAGQQSVSIRLSSKDAAELLAWLAKATDQKAP